MGIYKKIINIVNSNVYGTNLLLIPGMIISLLIVMDINIWSKNKDYTDNEIDKNKLNDYVKNKFSIDNTIIKYMQVIKKAIEW